MLRLDFDRPCTAALDAALALVRDHTARDDLLFLERWEMRPQPGAACALRVQQIRRANPGLAAAIRAEVAATFVGNGQTPPWERRSDACIIQRAPL